MKAIIYTFFILITYAATGQSTEPEGRIVNYPAPDGSEASMYFVDAEPTTDDYIFLFSDIQRLDKQNKLLADKFAEDIENINVIVLDLQGLNIDDKELFEEQLEAKVKGALEFIGNYSELGLIGIGKGTEAAYKAALLTTTNLKAVVFFNRIPHVDADELLMLGSDLLLVMSEDQLSTERLNSFKVAMDEAGKELIVETFNMNSGAGNNDSFKDSSLEKAYERTFVFLQRRLN